MQKKKKVTEIDQRYQKGLPKIKKGSRSTHNSPKNMLLSSASPVPEKIHFGSFEGNSPEELFIKKIEESKKQNIFTNYSSPGITSQPKVLEDTEVKTINREPSLEEINLPRKEIPEYMQETYSSNIKKNEIEQKRDARNIYKYKDLEILMGRQKVSELHDYINRLISENNELKIKIKNLEENGSRLYKSWQNTENSLRNYQNLLKTSDGIIKELQTELGIKQGEIQEMKDLLKKAENKRRAANEQMNDVESKLVLFQRQVQKLTNKLNESKSEISAREQEIQKKLEEINTLTKRISYLESSAELEKIKSVSESVEFGRSKESLLSQIEDLKLRIEKVEGENLRLFEVNNQLQQDLKKPAAKINPRKSGIYNENQFLSDINKEEASRWHSRYFVIEEQFFKLKEQLETYIKNENYFKTLLGQKNELIEKLEEMIKGLEKKNEEFCSQKYSETPSFKDFSNIGPLVKGLGENMRYSKE